MQSQTSDNSGFNKLKTILFLGLSCNYTTISGCIITWVLLQHNNWVNDWTEAALIVICVMPFFMGDAVNNYVLGRIRLEYQNNWNDIRIDEKIKERIGKLYNIYRAISICSAYGIVALIVTKTSGNTIPTWFPITVISLVAIHLSLALSTIITGIAPIIPSYKKQGIIHRIVIITIISVAWFFIFKGLDNINNFFVFVSGLLYFLICGIMHPLPSNGSLLGSILRESIIKNMASNEEENEMISYSSKNNADIEDASIVGEETNINTDLTSEPINNQENNNE